MSNWLPSGHLPSWLILFFVQNSSLHNNTIYTIYLLKLDLQLPLIPSLSSHSEQPTVHVQVLSGDLLNGNGEDLLYHQQILDRISTLYHKFDVSNSCCVIIMCNYHVIMCWCSLWPGHWSPGILRRVSEKRKRRLPGLEADRGWYIDCYSAGAGAGAAMMLSWRLAGGQRKEDEGSYTQLRTLRHHGDIRGCEALERCLSI